MLMKTTNDAMINDIFQVNTFLSINLLHDLKLISIVLLIITIIHNVNMYYY